MGVDGCGQMCKCILILFSALFAIVGFAMVGLGLGLRLSSGTRGLFDIDLETQEFVIFVVVLLVLGTLMLIVSICGFHGACSENISSLGVFSVLLGIMAGVEIGIGVLVFMRSQEVSQRLANLYASLYAQYVNKQDPSLGATLKIIHEAFGCCGVGGGVELFVRDTCPKIGILETFTRSNCPSVILNLFQDKAPLIMGFFLATAALMITALVCSSILSKAIKQNRQAFPVTYSAPLMF
ncbi:CD9 antigen-like isoform X2 [Clupea harengus]|uniref:Tetraspanin n=1 Tax=Clupea harengus TaxID=7950 RepID=A0A6P8FX87_CLUHA|nr:CD9 antigen-like isoform X2 [Clupea harengus]